MKILVVEDEKDVRELMLLHLTRAGHHAVGVEHGEEGMKALSQNLYDLVVLDWMLPGLSGLEICKSLRSQHGSPLEKIAILMVTARADTVDIVAALEAGADDYISKPFELTVFLARVKALIRRSQTMRDHTPQLIEVGELKIDLDGYQVHCQGEKVDLTPSEYKMLAALMENQGRALPRERLIQLVQGLGVAVIDRTVDTHIFGLRKKLGACADIIETIRGVGYRIRI